jgi:hypothetical protein
MYQTKQQTQHIDILVDPNSLNTKNKYIYKTYVNNIGVQQRECNCDMKNIRL